MEKEIKIIVKPEHFKASPGYYQGNDCPLGLAIREQFPTANFSVATTWVRVQSSYYSIPASWNNSLVEPLCDKAKESIEGMDSHEVVLTLQED